MDTKSNKLKHVRFYHAHVYFDQTTRASAERLRGNLMDHFAGVTRIHSLIDIAIGPHPLPMFEMDMPAEHKDSIKMWLEKNHNGHSVLIHPLSGDEMADHRDYPEWVGAPLKLNLEFLK